MTDQARDCFIVVTKGAQYLVTEETALTVVGRKNSGARTMIEFEVLSGGRVWVEPGQVVEVLETSYVVREFEREHNATLEREKKASPHYFEGGESEP